MPRRRPGLQGDVRSQIPYFTKFGQDTTVHPLLATLGRVLWEGSGAADIVDITRALGGDRESAPPPGYLPFQGGMRLGGRYAPRTPGLTAETLQRGDPMVDFEGLEYPAVITPSSRAYNLRNEAGEIVASADRQMYPAMREQSGSAYVPSMWVREDYRKTPAMFDLYNLLSRGGKVPLRATFANDRLRKAFEKRYGKPESFEPSPPLTKEQLAFQEGERFREERAWLYPRLQRHREWRRREVPAYQPMATRPINVGSPPSLAETRQLALALAMERQGRIPPRPTENVIQRLEREHAERVARGDWAAEAERRRLAPASPKSRTRQSSGRRGGV